MKFNIERTLQGNENLRGGEIVRISNGVQKTEGHYSKSFGPDTWTTVRVKTNGSNKVGINIDEEKLNEIVPLFGFVDEKSNKLIETANKGFALDPFFSHPDLFYDIKHSGQVLDTEDPMQNFWFCVFKADEEFFIDMPGSKAPPQMSMVKFKLTPVNYGTSEVPTLLDDYSQTYDFYNTLINMTRERKMFLLDALPTEREYDNNTPDKALGDMILQAIKNNSRIYTSELFVDFYKRIAAGTEQSYGISFIVKKAYDQDIINKRGDLYYYEGTALGVSLKEVEQNIVNTDNKAILRAVTKLLKEAQ